MQVSLEDHHQRIAALVAVEQEAGDEGRRSPEVDAELAMGRVIVLLVDPREEAVNLLGRRRAYLSDVVCVVDERIGAVAHKCGAASLESLVAEGKICGIDIERPGSERGFRLGRCRIGHRPIIPVERRPSPRTGSSPASAAAQAGRKAVEKRTPLRS